MKIILDSCYPDNP
jgi:DNA ligase-1